MALKTKRRILKSILEQTGSKCNGETSLCQSITIVKSIDTEIYTFIQQKCIKLIKSDSKVN